MTARTIWNALAHGNPRALAIVVRQIRSAPANAGTMMAFSADGTVIGNVSAGCVDAEVHALALQVVESGEPKVARFGVSDDTPGGPGRSLVVRDSSGAAPSSVRSTAAPVVMRARPRRNSG